jgi:small-conductance mechanosensitive channel
MIELLRRIQEGVFTQMVNGISESIPKIITALIVLLIGRLIAISVKKVIQKVLSALKIDQFGERMNDIDLVQRSGVRFELSTALAQVVYYFIMLCVIIMATDLLGIQIVTDMVRGLFNYLPSLASAFIIFLIGLFLADVVRSVLHSVLRSMGIGSAGAISTGIFYFLFITTAVSALGQAKVETGFISSNLTVVIGAICFAFAIGYGIASRDLMANYLAGYYNHNKVRIGDEIEIIGVRGKVVALDASSMILQTDERAIIIPLSKLTTEKVEVIYPDADDDQKRIEKNL